MRCIVVDDEKMILDALCAAVSQAGAEVLGAYQDPLDALESIKQTRPELVFLDVEMPGMNGIELAEQIKAEEESIQIVFVTAYEQYAIKAYELNAIHYLLKPVTVDKIARAIARAQRMQVMRQHLGSADDPALIGTPAAAADRLSVKVRDDILIIRLDDILFLKSEKGKTLLFTKDGSYLTRCGMAFWENRLGQTGFIRCHRSYMVNAAYIQKMVHILGEYRELVLSYCDVNIPVSRQRVGAVKRWMGIQ